MDDMCKETTDSEMSVQPSSRWASRIGVTYSISDQMLIIWSHSLLRLLNHARRLFLQNDYDVASEADL